MFRDHKARGTELGKKIQAIMDAGELVTDDITNAMVKDRLARPDVANGFILDGYPPHDRAGRVPREAAPVAGAEHRPGALLRGG